MANPYLQIENGAEAKRYELEIGTDDVIIGRSTECHWVVSSGAVSRRHARVKRQSGEITIEDLGSSNGTFVNGERLAEPKVVCDQDAIKFGSVEGHFYVPKPEPESDATISASDLPATMMMKPAAPATVMMPPPPEPIASPPPPPTAPHSASPDTAAMPLATSAATGKVVAPASDASQGIPAGTIAAKPPAFESPASGDTAFRPAPAPAPLPTPSPSQRTMAGATPQFATSASGPSFVELAVIAGASFLVVFGIGAMLIRFVF